MSFQKIRFLGLPITTGMKVKDVCDLLDASGSGQFITFINPYAWHLAGKNKGYLSALMEMDYVLPDGIGVAAACQKMTGFPSPRASFDMTSVAGPFFEKLLSAGKTVMLVGGAPTVAEGVGMKLVQHYPGLKVVGYCDGFTPPDAQLVRIMDVKPHAVIVAMGAPKQEQLLALLKKRGYEGVAITCGGFFDQFLQATQYYPPLINKLNLRFLYRLYKEPKRLWRRYLIEYRDFIILVLRTFIKSVTASPEEKKALFPVFHDGAGSAS